jgi:hypothetical protein
MTDILNTQVRKPLPALSVCSSLHPQVSRLPCSLPFTLTTLIHTLVPIDLHVLLAYIHVYPSSLTQKMGALLWPCSRTANVSMPTHCPLL